MTRIIRRTPPPAQPSPALTEALEILTRKDDDEPGRTTDYVAIIHKYASKVTNRASAIRAKCVECSGGALSEVRDCPVTKCALWPYRMGEDPNNKKTKARMQRDAAQPQQSDNEE